MDFLSSATAMKSIFRASFTSESDVGVAVHRLGDWLVIDDGSELSWCRDRSEELREAEQRHRACLGRVEAAQARACEASQQLEQQRQLLWEAELKVRQAEEELREAWSGVFGAQRDMLRVGWGTDMASKQVCEAWKKACCMEEKRKCIGDDEAVDRYHRLAWCGLPWLSGWRWRCTRECGCPS